MGTFKINGGKKLCGEIVPQGAKNEALQILCAVLLTDEEVVIDNIPDIRDVNKLIEILQDLGVAVKKTGASQMTFQADAVDLEFMMSDTYRQKASSLRGSIMMVGPLLARFGKGYIPKPGGDKIGRRRLDTHFIGLEKAGRQFAHSQRRIILRSGGRTAQGKLHAARRSLGHRDGQHSNGSRTCGRNNDHLQCRLRTLFAATVQDAQPHGRANREGIGSNLLTIQEWTDWVVPHIVSCPT